MFQSIVRVITSRNQLLIDLLQKTFHHFESYTKRDLSGQHSVFPNIVYHGFSVVLNNPFSVAEF